MTKRARTFLKCVGLLLLPILLVLRSGTAWCLEPQDVLVVANKAARNSVSLAKYYMQKRGIPEENLVTVWVTGSGESCTRKEYEKRIAAPVRKHLQEFPSAKWPRCLVTMFGVPLKVNAPELTRAERKTLDELRKKRDELKKAGPEAKAELKAVEKRLRSLDPFMRRAAVDSELSLILAGEAPLQGWVSNPYFYGNRNRRGKLPYSMRQVTLVSRLDGPTPEVVRRIVDDSLAAEREGLTGKAYFDARWEPNKEHTAGYGLYDMSIHAAAKRMRDSGRLPVVEDSRGELFAPGQAPDAALYCGWYSLGQYVDAFTWQRGAIGYHLASQECQSLKDAGSNVWCLKMLQHGVAATIGPVDEPYIQAFPLPELFFGMLAHGKHSLVECYFVSLPWLSWKMVLVGDPLYRPFAGQAR